MIIYSTTKISKEKFNFIIDDEDFERISKYTFYLSKQGYILLYKDTKHHPITHILLNVPHGMYVDHINGNPLDNRRNNLRIATPSQNMMNKNIYKNNKSGFKGVYFVPERNVWHAQIRANGKRIRKSFLTSQAAAYGYDKLAIRYHGIFAKTNF